MSERACTAYREKHVLIPSKVTKASIFLRGTIPITHISPNDVMLVALLVSSGPEKMSFCYATMVRSIYNFLPVGFFKVYIQQRLDFLSTGKVTLAEKPVPLNGKARPIVWPCIPHTFCYSIHDLLKSAS